jgi:hypothetical protein
MRLRPSSFASIVLVVLLAGCQSVSWPLFGQGSVREQQYNAQRWDPLPEPDSAPEIVGARGREYEKPVAQPSRARWDPRSWVQRWGW